MYQFKVYRVGQSTERGRSFAISASCSVLEFQSTLLNALDIPLREKDSVKLWLLNNQNTYLLQKLEDSAPFVVSDQLLSSDKNRTAHQIDTSTIPTTSSLASCLFQIMPSTTKDFYLAVDYVKNKPAKPSKSTSASRTKTLGLTGLQNLGNTCYMNSAIQCLSNTNKLTEWFANNQYKQDLNTNNPLGLNGELAKAYAALLADIWKPSTTFTTFMRSSVSPREFKSTFERFNPHFAGYMQQDSQELLSFLLDGLHEDLNRVLEKPYIEIPDFDSQEFSDAEIAHHFWQYHKARNDSIIVDLFQGQYKSRLICDECQKVSVTFDPFMHISVPLPRKAKTPSTYEINVIYVPYAPSQKHLKMKISLSKEATIEHLQKEVQNNLASLSLMPNNDHSLLVTEIHDEKIYKVFDTEELVDLIQPSDQIYVYQLPCSLLDQEWVVFPVYCSTPLLTARADLDDIFPIRQFGYPIIIAMKKSDLQDYSNLYTTIASHIERYCVVKLFEEDTSAEVVQSPTQAQLLNGSQSPIHTTAAVTPAGGRPMAPMPNLFQIKVFQYHQKNKKFNFPQGSDTGSWKEVNNQDAIVEQGQGVVIEWKLSKAQQMFSASVLYKKIDAWNDFDVPDKDEDKEVTLQNCLDEFAGDELLTSQDSWYCPQCKKHQHASKKMDIWKLPEIMIIHLKRFSQFRRWEETKLDTFVDFPLTGLDMSKMVLGPHEHELIYDLYAVDNHYGGMGGGHYTAFAQNFLNGEWYEFNDTHVTRMEAQDVKTSAAYILFYKRRS
ncbi:hypothetical protein EDC96DRAFT_85018 [Choanephora cucurbitarum]|nr:hypothetical protein EDC96DRAFT_85018 [Choanephora cucurbitarum]